MKRWDTTSRRGITKAEVVTIVAVVAVLAALMIPALLPRDRERAHLAACRQNLRLIGVALASYARENAGQLPVSETLDGPHPELTKALGRFVKDPTIFYCPSRTGADRSYSEQRFGSGTIGYFYYSADKASTNDKVSKFLLTGVLWPRRLETTMNQHSWVMSDLWFSGEPTSHAGTRKGVNYLMLDGSVDFVSESPRHAFH